MSPCVLVVDDEPALRFTLRALLEEEGWAVEEAADGEAALVRTRAGGVDLVLSDLRMPKMDGLALLDALVAEGGPRLILITAHGDERTAVRAMQRGALDYFAKPFENDEVTRVVRRALESTRLRVENQRLRAQLALSRLMVFESEAMSQLAERVERAARRDLNVLISGESGTGKELVALALVKASPRAQRPYVRFNCAALSPHLAEAELFGHTAGAFTGAQGARRGLFREADGGTILLDEIAELDPRSQGALLRVLQEGEVRPVGADRAVKVNARVLAATHRDLKAEVAAGRFREDLFYRLHVITLHVPPLRTRPEDIQPLAEHFARRAGASFGLPDVRLSPRFLARLMADPWPGNVRALQHLIEARVAMAEGPLIDDEGGVRPSATELDLRARVAAFEKRLIVEALAQHGGNQSATARALGLSRVTLIDKISRYGLRGGASA
ncbi:sigma-54 dependent transcriptional regulator [Myxococcota bacterium]|nr:sigma-54 dependent transcriptional regulator [Myxococcota bacterium]